MAVAKRIIVYILAAALSVGFIGPSVSAESAGDVSFIDLYSPTDSYYIKNGNLVYSQLQDVTRVWVSGRSSIRWTLPKDIYCDQIFFTVKLDYLDSSIKNSVQVNGSGMQNSGGAAICYGQVGSYYYFFANCFGNPYDIMIVTEGSTYSGNFTVLDLFGTLNNTYQPASVDFKLNGHFGASGAIYSRYVASQSGSLPMVLQYKHAYNGETMVDCNMELTISNFQSAFNDSLVVDIISCGSASGWGARLVDSETGDFIASLPISSVGNSISEKDDYFGSGTIQYPIYYERAVVDLSGYDLRARRVVVTAVINDVQWVADSTDSTGVYCAIENVLISPTVYEDPWYTALFRRIADGFQSVVDKLDEVFNGDSSAADDLENMEDQLEELTPTFNNQEIIDNVDDSINGNFDDGELSEIGSLLKELFYVMPGVYIILPFTLALVGYLLFGKRS